MKDCVGREVAYIDDGFLVSDPEGDVFIHYNHLLHMTSLHIRNEAVYDMEDPYLRIFAKQGRVIGVSTSGDYEQFKEGSPREAYAAKLYDHHSRKLGVDDLLYQYLLRLRNTFNEPKEPSGDARPAEQEEPQALPCRTP